MGHSFHQLYFHIVWSTGGRLDIIGRQERTRLLEIINEETKSAGGIPLRHNAMPNHVHLMARLPPTVAVGEFVEKVKGATAFVFNRDQAPAKKLIWDEGFGAVSMRAEELEKVSRYIDNQEAQHRDGKLSDLLERCELSQLYVHVTWGTQGRLSLIKREWRPRLLEILNEQVSARGGVPLCQNAMPDHVHALVRLSPDVNPSEFIGRLKGAASFLVNREIKPRMKLKWQEGYGAVTIREAEVPTVSRYIENQEEHHRRGKVSYLLERFEIEANEELP